MSRIDDVRADLSRLTTERDALSDKIRPLAAELSDLERIETAAKAAGMTIDQLRAHMGATIEPAPAASRSAVRGG